MTTLESAIFPPGVDAHHEQPLSRPDVNLESLGYHVFSTLEAPLGWSKHSLSQASIPAPDRDAHWQRETGVSPQDSHFTLIIPIHNEAAGLNTFLGTLMQSFVPSSVNAQIVFVTNACSDDSAELIRHALTTVSLQSTRGGDTDDLARRTIDVDLLKDAGISELPLVVASNRMSYVHIDTVTRGKANALNIGNELALQAGHRVVISLDSDCCPEPPAIMNMFGKAHAAIKRAAESPPVFSGLGSAEWNRGRHLPPKERAFEAVVEIDRDFNRGERGMLGWMMAWDARWLREVGGVPRAVVEDFALGLQAELRGGGREVVDARVWAYSPTRRGDHWKAVTRFTQGAFQQLDRYADDPQAKDLIRKEAAHLLSPRHIISKLTHDLLHSKVGVAKTAYRFAQHVQAFIVGWAMNRSYPDSQTWRQLDTTRLHQKN